MQAHRLSPRMPALLVFIFLGLYVPISYWTGWSDPSLFDIRGYRYPSTWASWLVVATCVALFAVPLTWVCLGRAMDVLALSFAINGLILCGYFVLPLTATTIYKGEWAIMRGAELTVAINAIGFWVLLVVLAAWYLFLRQKYPAALKAPDPQADERLKWVIYPLTLAIIGMTALPMLLTRTIPMLSGDPMEGRAILEGSNLGRPFYNLASSLLPIVIGCMVVLASRRRNLVAKWINPEVLLAGAALVTQFLTSNRLPLANSLLFSFCLISLERKFSRGMLILGFVGYLTLFLGLSGFSSILRQTRDMIGSENLIEASFREAFVGNNLSDLRDGAWVIGEWDFQPLNGLTYLGGLVSMVPSAVFPEKKQWYLGLVGIRIVNWPDEEHFGLRMSYFAESFLNFGLAGVVGLAVILGTYFAYQLRLLHLSVLGQPSLTRNVSILIQIQLGTFLSNTSEGFVFYSLLAVLILIWVVAELPGRSAANRHARLPAYSR